MWWGGGRSHLSPLPMFTLHPSLFASCHFSICLSVNLSFLPLFLLSPLCATCLFLLYPLPLGHPFPPNLWQVVCPTIIRWLSIAPCNCPNSCHTEHNGPRTSPAEQSPRSPQWLGLPVSWALLLLPCPSWIPLRSLWKWCKVIMPWDTRSQAAQLISTAPHGRPSPLHTLPATQRKEENS